MRPFEKAHIEKNLVQLIRNTNCNVQLLSILQQNEVLSQDDCEDVQSLKTASEKSRRLYEILPTRENAFKVLLYALRELKQTGAHKILQQTECKLQDFGLISVATDQLLGRGRLGTKVYLGRFDGRDVAVKVINEASEEALKEVNFLKKLDIHQNIVRYYMAEHKHNQIYIALELCLINLEDEMKMKLINPEPTIVLKCCTEGLAFLHRNCIIHRDVKPVNVLLNQHGQVKISDFGFSKQLEAGRSAASASGVVGTADWMSPELLKLIQEEEEGAEAKITTTTTMKSDVFSLGCLFYFVLTGGQHLFGKPFERSLNIVHSRPQWGILSEKDSIIKIIEKMTSHFPTERPTAAEILCSDYFNELAGHNSFPPNQMEKRTVVNLIECASAQCKSDFRRIKPSVKRKICQTPDNRKLYDKTEDSKVFRVDDFSMTNQNSSISEVINQQSKIQYRKMKADKKPDDLLVDKNNMQHTESISVQLKTVRNKNKLIHRIAKLYNFPSGMVVKITKNINTNINYNKVTLLHYAAKCESVDTLVYLIELGCNWRAETDIGETVLHYAAMGGNFEAIKYFVALGADVAARTDKVKATCLHLIAPVTKNFVETLRVLLDFGADIHATDSDGRNLVFHATKHGKSRLELQEIIRLGGNWKANDQYGMTVLHLAAENGYVDLINYFIELGGVDVNSRDKRDRSPLHCIASCEDFRCAIKVLYVLLKNKSEINAKLKNGWNLIHLATKKWKNREALEEIVRLVGDWNVKDNKGCSVLHFATWCGNFDAAKYFVELGADLNAKDNNGCSVLHSAASFGRVDIANFLVGLGADWNAKDKNKCSVLHYAAGNGHTEAAKYFVGLGVDWNAEDKFGCYPINYARKNGHSDVEEYFEELERYACF